MSGKHSRNAPLIMLVAGGSGGHLFPAASVVQVLRRLRPAWRVGLVMTRDPRDQRSLASLPEVLRDPQVEVAWMPRISTRWWRRMMGLPHLWSMSRQLLRRWQPAALLSFGGWLSVPVVFAAKCRRVPVMLHEQNVQPGRANRLLGRWADGVAVSFEETKRLWPRVAWKMTVTGNPIRFLEEPPPRAAARHQWGITDGALTILGVGGSGGAQAINEALPEACAQLPRELLAQLQIIHLTGNHRTDAVLDRYRSVGVSARVLPFLDQMASAYCAADLAVARAGASTVAELAHFGCPAILVPYPYARGHQRQNAQHVEQAGGAVVFEQDARLIPQLAETLARWLKAPEQLTPMRAHMRSVAQSDAATRAAQTLLALTKESGA